MNPPKMRSWNLALRFGLEIAALIGLGIGAWSQTSGVVRWIAVIVTPLIGAVLWGAFNVIGDPSRSGKAPIEVPGWVRMLLELSVLGAGWFAYCVAGYPFVGASCAGFTAMHYSVAFGRVRWLLGR